MKVKVIKTEGHAALIEFIENGMPQRVTVPIAALDGNEISNETALMGIDHGVQWAEVMPIPQITPNQLQAALRNSGIWTKADFLSNPNVIIGVLKTLYGLEYATLATAVKTAKEI